MSTSGELAPAFIEVLLPIIAPGLPECGSWTLTMDGGIMSDSCRARRRSTFARISAGRGTAVCRGSNGSLSEAAATKP